MRVEIIEVKDGYLYSVTEEVCGATLLQEHTYIQEGTMSYIELLEVAYARKYPDRVQEDIEF